MVGGVVLIGAVAGGITWYMKAHAVSTSVVASSSGGGGRPEVVGAISNQNFTPDLKVSNNNLAPPPSYSDAVTPEMKSISEPAIKNNPPSVEFDSNLSARADIDISIEDDDSFMTAL